MLTTLETLKARLKLGEDDVQDDDLLTSFIAGVSARLENECNRKFGYATDQTEEVQGDETEVRAARAPIISVTSFSLKASETTGWEVQTDVDYVIRRASAMTLKMQILKAEIDRRNAQDLAALKAEAALLLMELNKLKRKQAREQGY